MHYGKIKKCDIANGAGVRTTLFVSGCTHHCKECFNPETWDFEYGQEYTDETKNQLLELCKPDFIAGLTLLGGEPFEPDNQRALLALCREFKERYPDKNIWAYTGYTYEPDLLSKDGSAHTEVTEELLSYIDILVDGEFRIEEKNISLHFRGSENQRVIDLKTGGLLYTGDLAPASE
ncbi:MAG: anaerobic ribonucleoside-triphosphate reductase activating protein [Lachnospiraceae bacterium]|nr:anaerobic ribonucleoside-triphosphate reductase activating protein [Lachnospiraceae bacterium]